jgi:hypothetical protein
MAANYFRNRISMQTNENSYHGVKGSPFLLVGGSVGGEERGVFFTKVVFGVKSGLCTVHFPLGQFTFHASIFSFVFWGQVQSKGVPKFLTCSPKSSQSHLTFIPYALANVVLLSHIYMGKREWALGFTTEPSNLG